MLLSEAVIFLERVIAKNGNEKKEPYEMRPHK